LIVEHLISSERQTADGGNMSTVTPICSCGWRGFGVAAYNDDQLFQVRRQGESHLSQTKSLGVKNGR